MIKMEEKDVKKRKSRKTVVSETGEIVTGLRKLRKLGGVYYLGVPREYVERHGLKEGNNVPFVGDYVLKYIPVVEEEEDAEATQGETVRTS